MEEYKLVYKKAICIETTTVKINGNPFDDMFYEFKCDEVYEYCLTSIGDRQIYLLVHPEYWKDITCNPDVFKRYFRDALKFKQIQKLQKIEKNRAKDKS